MPKWGKNTDFEEFGEVVKTPKTVLELRTSGDSCGEGRGKTFPPLFCFLALTPSAFERISRAKAKTEVRVPPVCARKTGLELRTSGVCYAVGRGKIFPPLFRLLADIVGISQAKPQTEVRVTPVLREKRAGRRLPTCSFLVRKTGLELRPSGDSCGEGRGETFPLLFRLLADFVGISRLRLKTANGGTGSARFAQKKNRTPIGVLFFFGAENGT